MRKRLVVSFFIVSTLYLLPDFAWGQMITGIWHGKIDKQKVEVKLIQDGDSLAGTSYYYESNSHYRRYKIRGYFDQSDNSVVWWDDELIDNAMPGFSPFQKNGPILSRADFNCPGGGVMKLDGKTYSRTEPQTAGGEVHLDKILTPVFIDEWDFVIENYTLGANDPDVIDSVARLAHIHQKPTETIAEEKPGIVSVHGDNNRRGQSPVSTTNDVASTPMPPKESEKKEAIPLSIQQKFTGREKVFTKDIPVTGDSIELRFYDNAEVDGDSISLFLNDKLIFEHIRLTEKAYVVKLAVKELRDTNELTMVAENLGTIPPNTSYMVALVGDKRYDAQLASTENSSAMIRLKKASSY